MTVIVVGAGIIGCAVAYALASKGAHVRVFDARGIGQGATRASAGILAPYIEGRDPVLRRLAVGSLALYDDFIRSVRADAGLEIEYRRDGTLQVALDAAQEAEIEAAAHALAGSGVDCRLLAGNELRGRAEALSPAARAGLFVPQHGLVAASALTSALAAAARNRGAAFASMQVRTVEPADSHGVEVLAGTGRVQADAVVIAAGSWASGLSLPVRPVRGQLVHLRLGRALAAPILWGSRCYLVPWQDGSVLVGATVEDAGFDESSTAAGVRTLLDAAIELVPPLADAAVHDIRVGLRPTLADGLPAVGHSARTPGVVYAIGHYRSGILLAPLTAALVADLLLGGPERPELALVRPSRLGL